MNPILNHIEHIEPHPNCEICKTYLKSSIELARERWALEFKNFDEFMLLVKKDKLELGRISNADKNCIYNLIM